MIDVDSPKERDRWRGIALAALALVFLCVAGCAGVPQGRGEKERASISGAEELGIEVIGLRRSAAGYMLDFRFKVLDSEKAAPLLDHHIRPVLVDAKSGARLIVPTPPKIGALRTTDRSGAPVAGKVYYMMFANPGRFLGEGDVANILLDDWKIEGIIVE